MKKLLTLALVALTATASQALTIDWATVAKTVDSGYTSATIEQTATEKADETAVGGTLSKDVDWVAQATISFGATPKSQTLLCSVGTFDTVTYYYYNTSTGYLSAFATTYTDRGDGVVSGDRTVATTLLSDGSSVTVTYSWDASENTLSIYLGEDMTLLGSSVISDTTVDHDCWGNEDSVIVDNFQFVVGAAELATSTNTAGTLQAQNLNTTTDAYVVEANVLVGYTAEAAATLVPEPTCLALLALGVAGLALRRRA